MVESTQMPQNEERNSELQRGGMVEIRFRIPLSVAIWLTQKADEVYKRRNNYIKDFFIAQYRREKNGK
jgi:hypothetical protein